MPLVTIGIPVYNDDKYIAMTIEDIVNQNYKNLEIIISDNCSIDNTGKICCEYARSDERIKYIRQSSNIGAQMNFEFLLQAARGKYFMWAASDDRWNHEFILTLMTALEEDKNAAVAFCLYQEIDEEGNILSKPYRFDFSSKTVLGRILKFNIEMSDKRDAFFYALFNRKNIIEVKFIKWWWINHSIPMNAAFPILTHIVASGSYRFVDTLNPLWFNRIHIRSQRRHSAEFHQRPVVFYFSFVLRKINQFYESELAVVRGSKSVVIGILALPILISRCLFDFLYRTFFFIFIAIRHGWKRLAVK